MLSESSSEPKVLSNESSKLHRIRRQTCIRWVTERLQHFSLNTETIWHNLLLYIHSLCLISWILILAVYVVTDFLNAESRPRNSVISLFYREAIRISTRTQRYPQGKLESTAPAGADIIDLTWWSREEGMLERAQAGPTISLQERLLSLNSLDLSPTSWEENVFGCDFRINSSKNGWEYQPSRQN